MSLHLRSAVLLAAMLGPIDTKVQPPPISVVLACQDSRRMTATIRNVGTEDTAVIIGSVLANGRKYLVRGMTLQVSTGDGLMERYIYHPRHYPSGVAGRVDDWIIPLPAGASYALTLGVADFVGNNRRPADLPRNARLSLQIPLSAPTATPNSDVTGLRLFRVWTGSDTLMSNEIATSEHCR